MLWTTICIKNRTNIYSYASLTCTQSANQRKTKKKYTHIFGIHFLLPRKKNAQKYYFFCITFCCVFVFFYWYWFWLLFFGTFSRPFRVCLDSLHKENLNDLSIYFKRKRKWATERIVEFSLFEIFAVSQFFPQQCERESCIDVILLKKYIFIYFGVTKAKFVYP